MFSHFTLGTNDLKRAERFYAAVGPTLGFPYLETATCEPCLRLGPSIGNVPKLIVRRPIDDRPATWSNGYHLAFNVPDEQTVLQFHQAALAQGGHDEGRPGLRPLYAPDYFAAYVRDPDGNKLQAVCYLNGRKAGPTGDIISHITFGHADFERERRFYAAVLGALDLVEIEAEGNLDLEIAGFGIPGDRTPIIYIQRPFDGHPAGFGNGTRTAFKAKSRHMVDRFHQIAVVQGGLSAGEPGGTADDAPGAYAATVRDQVGNKLQAVYDEAAAAGRLRAPLTGSVP